MPRDPLALLIYLVVLIIVVFLVIYAINALAPTAALVDQVVAYDDADHHNFRIG